MRELDRLDATYGLGAMPVARPRRRGRARRIAVATLGTVLALTGTGAILAFAPGQAGTAFRRLTGLNEPHRLLAQVVPARASSAYKIEAKLPGGAPVTYDPCKPIHYVVNPAEAPADYLAFIQPAIREAQTASGLRLVYDGSSDDSWETRGRVFRRKPVLITFSAPSEVHDLEGDTVGLGGSTSFGADGRTPRYVTGRVALDASWFRQASAERRTREEQAIVMHELGHVLGLGHVKDRRELMYADSVGQLGYGPGDLAGLAKVGSGPCD